MGQILLGIAFVGVTALFVATQIIRFSSESSHPWIAAIIGTLFAAVSTFIAWTKARTTQARAKEQEARIEKAESKAEAEPEKAKFAWDVVGSSWKHTSTAISRR